MPDKLVEHLKWAHTGLTAFCASYFFVLLSGYKQLNSSFMLMLSTTLFAIALVMFSAFTIFHVTAIEKKLTSEDVEKALDLNPQAQKLTNIAMYILVAAVLCLVGHFSLWILAIMLVVSFLMWKQLKPYLAELNRLSKEHEKNQKH
ncbi:hypothetical protein [Photobacterium halotolerans]|uniref:Uncharacterized protein n=1 Tax=Photobacterium halotolerans TaxID=265726 RepID=A0A0F5VFJ8_9GAMM|nr:hypothetical protein [Photobacterium halotolerans]KKD00909.1 hypothetical protein KY46_03685 [Photobacterium halotolerans]